MENVYLNFEENQVYEVEEIIKKKFYLIPN